MPPRVPICHTPRHSQPRHPRVDSSGCPRISRPNMCPRINRARSLEKPQSQLWFQLDETRETARPHKDFAGSRRFFRFSAHSDSCTVSEERQSIKASDGRTVSSRDYTKRARDSREKYEKYNGSRGKTDETSSRLFASLRARRSRPFPRSPSRDDRLPLVDARADPRGVHPRRVSPHPEPRAVGTP